MRIRPKVLGFIDLLFEGGGMMSGWTRPRQFKTGKPGGLVDWQRPDRNAFIRHSYQRSTTLSFARFHRDVQATLQVVDPVAARLKCRSITKPRRPNTGIAGMPNVPAHAHLLNKFA